jgi:hypothetical protein
MRFAARVWLKLSDDEKMLSDLTVICNCMKDGKHTNGKTLVIRKAAVSATLGVSTSRNTTRRHQAIEL